MDILIRIAALWIGASLIVGTLWSLAGFWARRASSPRPTGTTQHGAGGPGPEGRPK
jgi:hypothetical protein